MMFKILLFFLFALNTFAESNCSQIGMLSSDLEILNTATVSDIQIITAEDLRFCPNQKITNDHISPKDLPDNGQVWRVGNRRWNEDWEKKYQDFLSTENIETDFFSSLGIKTDCGEAAMYQRAIFARIHNLPVSFKGGGFSNFGSKWGNKPTVKIWNEDNWREDLKKDQRFLSAIKEWGRNTGTVHFYQDTYPIKVFNDSFTGPAECVSPGAILLTSGHVETLVKGTSAVTPLQLAGSSSPEGLRELDFRLFKLEAPVDLDESKEKGFTSKTGLYHWNWIVNCNGKYIKVKDTDMPNYSLEQFTHDWDNKKPKFSDVNTYLFEKFKKENNLNDEQAQELIKKEALVLIKDIEESIIDRKVGVDEALEACKVNNITGAESCYVTRAKMKDPKAGEFDDYIIDGFGRFIPVSEYSDVKNTVPEQAIDRTNTFNFYQSPFKAKSKEKESFYYEYSSPNRDSRLAKKWRDIKTLLNMMDNKGDSEKIKLMDKEIVLKNNKKINYFHFLEAISNGSASPQPWDSEEKRWGEEYLKERSNKLESMMNLFLKNRTLKSEMLDSEEGLTPAELKRLKAFKDSNELLIQERKKLKEYFKK